MKSLKPAFSSLLIVMLCMQLVFVLPAAGSKDPWANSRNPHRFWNSKNPAPVVMVIDGILVRPVSFVATVIGGVFYVITWPFSAAGGNSDQAWDQMVKAPARATFDRPLGVFYVNFDEKDKNEEIPQRVPSGVAVIHATPEGDNDTLENNGEVFTPDQGS